MATFSLIRHHDSLLLHPCPTTLVFAELYGMLSLHLVKAILNLACTVVNVSCLIKHE